MCSPHILRFVSMCVCETFRKKNKEFKASLMTSFTLLLKLAPKLRNSTKNSHGFIFVDRRIRQIFMKTIFCRFIKNLRNPRKKIYTKKLKNLKNHCLKYFIVSEGWRRVTLIKDVWNWEDNYLYVLLLYRACNTA